MLQKLQSMFQKLRKMLLFCRRVLGRKERGDFLQLPEFQQVEGGEFSTFAGGGGPVGGRGVIF
jgi:hypothetical protein